MVETRKRGRPRKTKRAGSRCRAREGNPTESVINGPRNNVEVSKKTGKSPKECNQINTTNINVSSGGGSNGSNKCTIYSQAIIILLVLIIVLFFYNQIYQLFASILRWIIFSIVTSTDFLYKCLFSISRGFIGLFKSNTIKKQEATPDVYGIISKILQGGLF